MLHAVTASGLETFCLRKKENSRFPFPPRSFYRTVNNKRYDKFCVQNKYITTKIVFFPSSHSLISIEKNRASYDASIPLPFQKLSFPIVARVENERVKSTRRKDAAVYARGAKLSRFDIDTPSRKGNFSSRIHDYRVNVAPAGCSRQRGRATIRARGYSTPFPSHRLRARPRGG